MQKKEGSTITNMIDDQIGINADKFALKKPDNFDMLIKKKRRESITKHNISMSFEEEKDDDFKDPASDPDLKDHVENIKQLQQSVIINGKDDVKKLVAEIQKSMSVFVKRKMEIQFRILMLEKKLKHTIQKLESINLSDTETTFIRVHTLKAGDSFGELALIS